MTLDPVLETFGMQRSIDSASTTRQSDTPSRWSRIASDTAEWLSNNVAKPMINGALIDPIDAVSDTFHIPIHIDQLRTSRPTSAVSRFVQDAAYGVGVMLPYTIAGAATGGALGLAGEALHVTGMAARVLQSGKVAMVLGAGIYDAMREVQPGQTRIGNSIGSVAGFSTFMIGNAALASVPFGRVMQPIGDSVLVTISAKAAGRVGVGAVGAIIGGEVASQLGNGSWLTTEQMKDAAVKGATMNVMMPTIQDGAHYVLDRFALQTGAGAVMTRFSSRNGLKAISTVSEIPGAVSSNVAAVGSLEAALASGMEGKIALRDARTAMKVSNLIRRTNNFRTGDVAVAGSTNAALHSDSDADDMKKSQLNFKSSLYREYRSPAEIPAEHAKSGYSTASALQGKLREQNANFDAYLYKFNEDVNRPFSGSVKASPELQ